MCAWRTREISNEETKDTGEKGRLDLVSVLDIFKGSQIATDLPQWKMSKLERGDRLKVNVATLTHTSLLGKDDLPLGQVDTVEHCGSKS